MKDVFRRHKRLVVFDMDSILIKQEVIDEIVRLAGVIYVAAAITESAMNGTLVKDNLVYTGGAKSLCKALKKVGFKLAVISGGFIPLARHISFKPMVIYKRLLGPIVDGERIAFNAKPRVQEKIKKRLIECHYGQSCLIETYEKRS
ncbi:4933_t:CDS:2 [Diversispora eburnea]|uniref:phosphoserine phosphatase n=1 Tax=Diversispora eburnea TaxID=1213867 RepID=A0A9N8VC84_9GLOM|nr:4933_t:CDS:2 [Diversispora eburnea]